MRYWVAIIWLMSSGYGVAQDVSLRQTTARGEAHSFDKDASPNLNGAATDRPTNCDRRIAKIAVVLPMRRMIGPGNCGGDDMVRIDAVLLADHSRVVIEPAPHLRCAMAEQLALWVRDDVAPLVKAQGAALSMVNNYNDYECRSRNRQPGGKLSEHGKGNAIDVRGLGLADGHVLLLTDMMVPKAVRDDLRKTACERFTTVLGPGSDGYHEAHIHLDLAERHNGYRICHWVVRDPPKPGPDSGSSAGTADSSEPLLPPVAGGVKARKM
jgi:hypothetical protein